MNFLHNSATRSVNEGKAVNSRARRPGLQQLQLQVHQLDSGQAFEVDRLAQVQFGGVVDISLDSQLTGKVFKSNWQQGACCGPSDLT